MTTPRFNIATDCDEVLFNICGKWMLKILENRKIMDWLERTPEGKASIQRILSEHPNNREDYMIHSCLVPGMDRSWIPEDIFAEMNRMYFGDKNFYDGIPKTPYLQSLLTMAESGLVGEITVVTSCVSVTAPVTSSKIAALTEVFAPIKSKVKVSYLLTEKGETKSAAIRDAGFAYHTFVDDCVENIVDVIENTDSREKEFLIPIMRYNVHDHQKATVTEKAAQRSSKALWFQNGMKPVQKNEREIVLVDVLGTYQLNGTQLLPW